MSTYARPMSTASIARLSALACLALVLASCAGSVGFGDPDPEELDVLTGSSGIVKLSFLAEGSNAGTYTIVAVPDTDGITATVSPASAEADGDPVELKITVEVDATVADTRGFISVEAHDEDGVAAASRGFFVNIPDAQQP